MTFGERIRQNVTDLTCPTISCTVAAQFFFTNFVHFSPLCSPCINPTYNIFGQYLGIIEMYKKKYYFVQILSRSQDILKITVQILTHQLCTRTPVFLPVAYFPCRQSPRTILFAALCSLVISFLNLICKFVGSFYLEDMGGENVRR